MRLTMHLVRKELRDARAVVVGTALATAALAFVAAWFVRRFMGKGWTPEVTSTFIPLATGLGAALAGAAVAAESFAGDATSRRIEVAALLPVSLARVFAAKALATGAAWALAAAWTATVILLAVTVFGADTTHVKEAAVFQAVLASVPVVAGVVLLACVLEHGLGAVLGAIVLVGGGGFLVLRFAPWEEWGLMPRAWDVLGATVPVTFVLGVAAWLAFVRGPIHLAWRVRRAALGLGTALVVLVGGGAAAAEVLDARVDVEPGDPDAQIVEMSVSPDGTYVVLIVGNRRAPVTSQAWSVRLGDGAAVRIPGRYWTFDGWGPDGHALLWGGTRTDRHRMDTIRFVDPATGVVVATRSAEQAAASWRDRWARVHRTIDGLLIEWQERGVKRRFDGAVEASAAPRPGRICVWFRDRRVSIVDLDSGAEQALPEGAKSCNPTWGGDGCTFGFLTRDERTRAEFDWRTGTVRPIRPPAGAWGTFGLGPYATFHPDRSTVAVTDLRDGRVVAGPWQKRAVSFVSGSDCHAVVSFHGPEQAFLMNLATGGEGTLEPNPDGFGYYPPHLIHALPDGGFLVVRPGNGVDVIDGEGKTLRTVLAPSR